MCVCWCLCCRWRKPAGTRARARGRTRARRGGYGYDRETTTREGDRPEQGESGERARGGGVLTQEVEEGSSATGTMTVACR